MNWLKLSLFVLIAFLFSCDTAQTQEKKETIAYIREWEEKELIDDIIRLSSSSFWSTAFLVEEGDSLIIKASVIEGDDISFVFWTNAKNYRKWSLGQDYTLFNRKNATYEYEIRTIIPKTDTIFFVIGNEALFSSKLYKVKISIKREIVREIRVIQ